METSCPMVMVMMMMRILEAGGGMDLKDNKLVLLLLSAHFERLGRPCNTGPVCFPPAWAKKCE